MLTEKLRKYRIILASKSLRRQQLLRETGIDFEIVLKEYDESFPEGLAGEKIARHVAVNKSKAFSLSVRPGEIVITADTIVWCDGMVLGKPEYEADAIRMLKAISGKTHQVITGVSLLSTVKNVIFTDTTLVTFRVMSEPEIHYYVDKYAPYDKAGAYGIQEWIGLAACSRIEGSYFNVVGLPVHKLYEELEKMIS